MPKKIQFSEKPPRLAVKALDVQDRGDEVFSLRFENPGLIWQPGDCIAVYAEDDSDISRPYSLSGAVQDAFLEIWVRRFPGGCLSPYVCGRRVGDVIEISPSFGWFRPAEPVGVDKIYFATGTGIAPFLSAIRSGTPAPTGLYWGMRKPLALSELSAQRFLSQSQCEGYRPGRVTQVLSEIQISPQTHIYACGLDRMIEEVMAFFSNKGIPGHQLHRECFFTAAV